ncbi:MAG TPA: OmpA family protein [Polyangiaceae bacterium]|nr:OmpA family protein [Polyangiaceae bacterium]
MKLGRTQCRRAAWTVCGALAVASAACASDKNQPAKQPSELAPVASSEPTASQDVGRGGTAIRLSDEIMADCRFPANPGELPQFDVDKASLHPRGRDILADVANCMKDGPLQNRTITIIGRTDVRGTDEHNHELGANRAEATRNYLIAKGVPEQKLLVVSRGEQGATGYDSDGMALDRRVDLVLGDATKRSNISEKPAANAPAQPSNGAASYADQAEGGHVTGSSGPGTASGK